MNEVVTWVDVKSNVKISLVRNIIKRYDLTESSKILVIGVSRGGLPVATLASHILETVFDKKPDIAFIDIDTRHNNNSKESVYQSNVLTDNKEKEYDCVIICDDILDTGLTFSMIERTTDYKNVCGLVVTASRKPKINIEMPIFYESINTKWVDFPWEISKYE